MKNVHIHLISDSSGETVSTLARACLNQFEGITFIRHDWWLVRTKGQVERVLQGVTENPGMVLYTLVDHIARSTLEQSCLQLGVPCMPVLDPILTVMASHLQTEIKARQGRQFQLDAEYFARIEAMQYTLAHDDGQMVDDLKKADIVLVGVSRTSKTPTSMYLANRGFKCANYPLVAQLPVPQQITSLKGPLVVGLTGDPNRLAEIRRTRLKMLQGEVETDYVLLEKIEEEVRWARRLFTRYEWPVVDITRRSIEEAAAAIMQLYQQRSENDPAKGR
jgi:[pyruvate, water dikinase]-phosphate phosphotransferase / [pyruvate, water dikinase] kinase